MHSIRRGLDMCVRDERVHYIDTDLPEVVAVKQDMMVRLQLDKALKGQFDVLPLNAVGDAAQSEVFDSV